MANTTQDARSGRGRLGVTAGIALVGCGVLLFGVGLLVGMAIGVQRAERAAQGSPEVSAQGNETRGPTASEASVETAPKTSITREQRERVDALFASIDKFATNEFAANEEKMGNIQNLVDIAKTGEPAVAEYIFQRASAIVRDLSKPINQRWMTCYVLSGSGDARAVDVLAQVLERDPEGMVRGVAACALGYFASAEARAVLEEAARREVSPGVQADIRRSLERLAQQGVGASVRFEERDSHSAPALALPYEETEVRKLPWPHQAPGLSESEIEQLNQTVWVINDFPLYQSDDAGAFRYFHGGLDIVLPNGTPVYAMKDGWVKGVSQGSVKIADARDGTPCYGWEYSHLGNIRVGVGDFVERGTCIGEVQFDGLEHIHLGKAFSQDPYWDSWHYFCAPNAHFTYADRAPPVIASISFFQNNADSRFEPDASGNATVRGEVDIVVGIRDPGEFAHSRDSGYGDRLSAARIDYAIRRK
ncbi:MAG TPA: peptidoglycan DD-metalloendopeptidase family protein, partial [Candidatus Hydrogenedentes bacterium]|nr:peptidoglycan DD-metalloendopeptidase family protein [Candidatus Hydrogenedentota bacterium]